MTGLASIQHTGKLEHLGQTGLKIDLGSVCVLVDPYLSNSVQELDAPDLVRQVPIAYPPSSLNQVDWVLITHEHMDHCDPHTIPRIAEASPGARFMAPEPVRRQLLEWDISKERVVPTSASWTDLGAHLRVRAVPAAHPRIILAQDGQPKAVGYLLERHQKRILVAGDTSACEDVITSLKALRPIHTALLPVNEDNFFRRRRGIVGNMSVREAFGLAAELEVREVVPVHWDLFEVNSTSPEEIQAVYQSRPWPFRLVMNAGEVTL
jgi:L-ascorbate metabolism protein UlaG (beta-lactamase superfamily)